MLKFKKLSNQQSTSITINVIVFIISILVYSISFVAFKNAHDDYNDIMFNMIFCSFIQFLALLIIGMLWTRSVANRNLMQKR